MRLRIEIDDQLVAAAMAAGDFKTQKAAIEEGLRRIARTKAFQNIRDLRGKVQWSLDGDWTTQSGEAPDTKAIPVGASA